MAKNECTFQVINQSFSFLSDHKHAELDWRMAIRVFSEAEERLWLAAKDIYIVTSAGHNSTSSQFMSSNFSRRVHCLGVRAQRFSCLL